MQVAFIQCTADKNNKVCEAKLLYAKSTLFRASLDYTLSKYENVAILSAKHHCVRLNDILEPYNLCLNDFSKEAAIEWSKKTVDSIKEKFPNITEAHFYVGKEYRQYLIPLLEKAGIKCYSYLEHLTIGYKVQWFKTNTPNLKCNRLF